MNLSKTHSIWLTVALGVVTAILYFNYQQLSLTSVIVQLFLYSALSFSLVAVVHLFDAPTATPFLYEESPAVAPVQTFTAPTDALQQQQSYLDDVYGKNKTELIDLAVQIPQMSTHCLLAINLPAYREGKTIYRALAEYTIKQKDKTGKPLFPQLFEINILLNRPRSTLPFDLWTEREILRFKQDYPHYQINLLKKTFQFTHRPLMGTIYKILADLAIYRSLHRADSPQQARFLLRTGGADAREKNPYFLSHLLEIFEQPSVAVYRSESRYPQAILQKCPLFHVLYVLESGLNRVYTHGHSNVGLGTYSAEIYAHAGGFNRQLPVAEEIDLAKRMAKIMAEQPGKYVLKKDLWKNALDNPRRAIWALYTNRGMANKYDYFGVEAVEEEIHAQDWEAVLLSKKLPKHLQLTPTNLAREVTFYYQQYLTRVRLYSETLTTFKQTHPVATKEEVRQQTYLVTQKIFQRMFMHLGIPKGSYQFVQRDLHQAETQAHILFKDISHLEILLERRTFRSHQVFNS